MTPVPMRRPVHARRPLTRRCHAGYLPGMVVTIDNAGRLVVPKPLREQFNLTPGCELEIEAGVNGITLRRADTEPALVRKEGILVHHGKSRTALDVGEFVRAERNTRHACITRSSH